MERLVICFICLASPLWGADRPLTTEEFDAYTRGKTLHYSAAGELFGIEDYLEGRRVRWSSRAEDCLEGRWYGSGEDICFIYEGRDDPVCWQFFFTDGRLTAQVSDSETALRLYELSRSDERLQCLGPQIGS